MSLDECLLSPLFQSSIPQMEGTVIAFILVTLIIVRGFFLFSVLRNPERHLSV